MEPEELYAKVRHEPFEPFRLHVSDGKVYEIRHPEQIMIGRRSSHVGIGANGEEPFQRIATVSNVHITRLEPLDGFETTVVAFTTDVPSFDGAWGQPFVLGPGNIHVAHTSEERVEKRALAEAAQIYQRMVRYLLAAHESSAAVKQR